LGDDQFKKIPIESPALSCKLGQIRFNHNSTKPLGGLNPYSPQFEVIGKQLVSLLINHARLSNNTRILDLGCGTGRLAKQLPDHKHYIGLDINEYFLSYCIKQYPHHRFILSEVQHDEFNPSGAIQVGDYSLPIDNCSIDLVACFGLFNHFYMEWFAHYINLLSHVLKAGGIILCTCLLLNDHSILQIEKGKTNRPFTFQHDLGDSKIEYSDRPLLNTAIPEILVRRCFMENKLLIKEPILYGTWCNHPNASFGHDIIIARKNGWGA
jgi:SAM-dependent methyltransferase